MDIHVPNEKAGLLIGEGGDTIELLETKSGTGIQDSAMTICMDVFNHLPNEKARMLIGEGGETIEL